MKRRLRPSLCAALVAVATIAGGGAGADGPLRAARLDAANFAALTPGGADASAGVGDFALSNGALCAVVSDASRESDLAPFGGALVDLGHCGRGDDQLVIVQPLANLARSGAVRADEVAAVATPDEARVETRGHHGGCEFDTTYALDPRDPTRLRITTRVARQEPGPRVFAVGDVALQTLHALRPFALGARDRGPADGFAHPAIDVDSPFSIAAATRPDDTVILVGAGPIEPGIAYALRATRAERRRDGAQPVALPVVSLSAESFSGLAAFSAPFWLGADRLSPVAMLQTLWIDVPVGDTLVFEREIRVSARADVASLTDALFADSHRVAGRVDDPGASLVVADAADGRVLTQVRPGPDGAFAFAVPSGAYRLDVLGSAGGAVRQPFAVRDADVELGAVAAPPRARVRLPRGTAMRLTFLGEGGTPDPRFGDERPALRFGDAAPPPSALTRDVSLAGVDADPAEIALAPGRYRVLAGRGPEFGVTEGHLDVAAGDRVELAIAPPPRDLETPGWIHADLHVHAAPSDDSAVPLATRVASYVAEGDEVLVATDHDMVTDYGPVIRELHLASAIASVAGQEVTSSVSTPEAPRTFGHANAFPLTRRPLESRGGAIRSEGRRLREVVADVRALGGDRIVQLNHPRAAPGEDGSQHFFDHLSFGAGFDPKLPLRLPPDAVLLERGPRGTRDLDFDAVELLNGPSLERYRRVREDWFALLRQGVVRTATANSDSHRAGEIAAAPRNLVRASGSPAHFDEGAFVRAVRAGAVVGTTGPILEARVGDAQVGELHRGGEAAIRVDVRAASWVPVSRARVFVDGRLAHESGVSPGTTVWFPHHFDADAFVTVEVEGDADPTYAARLPGFTPFAFTNPIFVDADGDGRWSAPEPADLGEAPRPTP